MASRQALHIFTPSRRAIHILTSSRGIASTPHLSSFGWFDKIKSTITGKKPEEASEASSFTLIQFADTMEKARKLGTFKNFVAGRASEATVVNNLRNTDKINATKHCNCTIADVEHILAKYTWAKEAQKKIAKLKEEGKPLPKSFNEVQNLMGSTPVDVGRSNLAKSGQISRNAFCPCGSKKRYKRFDISRTVSITKLHMPFFDD
ncbi:hypothetical protein Zm00014a_026809 [Zea mays]|uniref:Uncharacterized protein n=1 Tax=Zea mays TaxID=4577 RepID=A0A3L6D9L4_MAIZE|nr:hypothetical protein Zm00014a_026809 [Zea mays]